MHWMLVVALSLAVGERAEAQSGSAPTGAAALPAVTWQATPEPLWSQTQIDEALENRPNLALPLSLTCFGFATIVSSASAALLAWDFDSEEESQVERAASRGIWAGVGLLSAGFTWTLIQGARRIRQSREIRRQQARLSLGSVGSGGGLLFAREL